MRRSSAGVMALVIALLAGGCDDGTELSDAELLVGNWNAVTVILNGQNITPLLMQQIGAITASFTAAGSFTLAVDYIDPEEEDEELIGSYTVNEREEILTLSIVADGETTTFPMAYRFETEDRVVLTFDTAGELIGGMTGSVNLTIQRV